MIKFGEEEVIPSSMVELVTIQFGTRLHMFQSMGDLETIRFAIMAKTLRSLVVKESILSSGKLTSLKLLHIPSALISFMVSDLEIVLLSKLEQVRLANQFCRAFNLDLMSYSR